ncbi:MAG: TIGR02757 family protein [Bacteroidia bacterium]
MKNKVPSYIAQLLNEKVIQYKQPTFIQHDPISIPHLFDTAQDKEIAGLLTAIISWGNRKSIIQSAKQLMQLLQYRPYEFVMNYSISDNKILKQFYYRTFQPDDVIFFIKALHKYYSNHHSLENIFISENIVEGIHQFREEMLKVRHFKRSEKHLPDVKKGSAAKRINMFLRWMVRKDEIDFGLWKNISTRQLLIPLDIHTSRTAYDLGLLDNTNNHLKNVIQLTELLKTLDENDPVKYDFALFGIGVFEKSNLSSAR